MNRLVDGGDDPIDMPLLIEAMSDDLGVVASLVRGDDEGMREFGEFYGRAPERLAPLLDPKSRRLFLIVVRSATVGFIDVDLQADVAAVSYFVKKDSRRKGYARAALDQLARLNAFPTATSMVAGVQPSNLASLATVRSAGYSLSGETADGYEPWALAIRRR